MEHLKISNSTKKFLRREKARIRAMFLDLKKQDEMVSELYQKFSAAKEVKKEPVEKETKGVKEIKQAKALKAKDASKAKKKQKNEDKTNKA